MAHNVPTRTCYLQLLVRCVVPGLECPAVRFVRCTHCSSSLLRVSPVLHVYFVFGIWYFGQKVSQNESCRFLCNIQSNTMTPMTAPRARSRPHPGERCYDLRLWSIHVPCPSLGAPWRCQPGRAVISEASARTVSLRSDSRCWAIWYFVFAGGGRYNVYLRTQWVFLQAENTNTNTNTKYTCDTGQTRNKLLEQWVHLTHSRALEARYYASNCLKRSI